MLEVDGQEAVVPGGSPHRPGVAGKASDPRDGSRAVFWSTRGRQVTVSVNAAALAELEPVVLALHEAARQHIPRRRR